MHRVALDYAAIGGDLWKFCVCVILYRPRFPSDSLTSDTLGTNSIQYDMYFVPTVYAGHLREGFVSACIALAVVCTVHTTDTHAQFTHTITIMQSHERTRGFGVETCCLAAAAVVLAARHSEMNSHHNRSIALAVLTPERRCARCFFGILLSSSALVRSKTPFYCSASPPAH